MHAVALFGCYLRQGHRILPTFVRDTDESYQRQVHTCWKFWQHLLSPDEVRQLLALLDQSHNTPHRIRRFLDRFKQYAIAHHIDDSVAHLSARISRNGWTYGPSLNFLAWLAQTPVAHVGAVPRFAVMRWALGEDADLWLPVRGRASRTSPCAWCGRNARNYPAGLARGALCYTCTGPQPGFPEPMSEELLKSLPRHGRTEGTGLASPNIISPPFAAKLLSSTGPAAQFAPIPCVLCQGGANAIDHWLSYCPVIHGAWLLLWKGNAGNVLLIDRQVSHFAICYSILDDLSQNMGGYDPPLNVSRFDHPNAMSWICGNVFINPCPLPCSNGFKLHCFTMTCRAPTPNISEYKDSRRRRLTQLFSRIKVCALIEPSAISPPALPSCDCNTPPIYLCVWKCTPQVTSY